METQKYPSVIKWSLVVGIVIVTNLFLNYLISLVYTEPKYDDFCKQEQVVSAVETQDACLAVGGQWNANELNYQTEPAKKGYCDVYFTCSKKYDEVYSSYNRNVFVALVVAGVLMLAASFALVFNFILSAAFSSAGILSIIIASMRYWQDADNLLRVIILFLALLALIYFAVRKFKN